MFVDYAKISPEDMCIRIEAVNRGPEAAPLHVLPHLWFRNSWTWGYSTDRPELRAAGPAVVKANHKHLGAPTLLFTENETNQERLYGVSNKVPYVKDAFHDAVVGRRRDGVNIGGF